MSQVGAFEAKNTLGTLLDRVERGEDIVITRYGKPVARLTSPAGSVHHGQAASAAQRIRERATTLKPATFDWPALKADRDEGRP